MSLHMYCKTRCFGTATQRVLFGSFHEHGTRDMILVKNSSLEYCSILNISGKLVHSSFEQPAFGTILDARPLKCEWADDQEEGAEDDGDSGIKVATDAHEDDRGNSEETRGNARLQCLTRKGHARINGDHVAMLISDYGELVFCTVVGEPEKLIDFPYALSSTGRFECVAEVMLGKPGLDFTTANKKLALDPWSRAVAIASYQDQIDVLVLKPSMSRTKFNPVANTVSIEETGIIWHLEFLHTKSNQRDRVLLAAIIYSDIDRVCRVVLYNIDTSNPEAPSADLMGRLPMDQKMALPVLFFSVPFYPETLVLVTEEAVLIVRATDITSGNVFLPGAVMGRTIGHHLCTAYTLCANESDPRVYLGTTEGQLIRLDMHDLEAIALSCVQKVNPIGQHIQALDYLDLEDNDGNKMPAMALYTVGEGTNSQLLAVTDDEAIELQAIENRAPVMDAVDESNAHTAFKMTTCSGKDQDAQLNTVTYGCNTDLMETVPDWNGVTNLWTLNGGEHGVFLVGSSCYDTKIARVHNESDGLISTWPAIATSSSTIHAELMYPTCHKTDRINAERDALIVQVLADRLLLLDFESPDPLLVYHFKEGSKDSRTTAVFASVQHVFQEASHLLLCCTEGDQTGMHRVYVDYKNKKISRFEKQTDTWFAGHPSCFFADQFVLAFIGDYNGNLHMYNTGMDAKPWKLLNTCSKKKKG
ncbi:mono-functional DNA-alkylating methyl methanesulfonate N-term-domain-containing protein [Gongronella butleri]|nr:mono-functional DNA-alkylating methyl methanesulfonate N-term-domain-containing protein [Gongronella butleri]